MAGEGGEMEVRKAMRRAVADRADDSAPRHELIFRGCHDAGQMSIHSVETAAVIEDQRAALAGPIPDRAVGGGADRRAIGSPIGVDDVERVPIPTAMRAAAVALDDLPGFARRRRQRELWRGLGRRGW